MKHVIAAMVCLSVAIVSAAAQEGPAIQVEKSTNGFDADLPPGPTLQAGVLVTWLYVVTNSGDSPLSQVTVEDDQGVEVHCPLTDLEPGQSMACTGQGLAVEGPYANLATATGQPPEGEAVSDTDASHYFGVASVNASIQLEKSTNGEDADSETGPVLPVNAPLLWEYVVTNGGDVPLFEVTVVDDQGVDVLCPKGSLSPNEVMTCVGEGTAQAGQYANLGTVTGRTAGGQQVSDSDASHYLGVTGIPPQIDVEKSTNGVDADQAPGPIVIAGSTVNWRYRVTNTGGSTLFDVAVSDDQGVEVLCSETVLRPTESMTCLGQGTAQVGQYSNLATAEGTTVLGFRATDTDASHYFGQSQAPAAIRLEKSTNGQDADQPPGPSLPVGQTVVWVYLVSNIGSETLQGISVSDDQGEVVECPQNALPPGESMACTAQGIVAEGLYSNLGSVTAETEQGIQVQDEDASHYTGVASPPTPPETVSPIYFPQFGNGAGLTSEIVLANPSAGEVAEGSVELYSAAGDLLDLSTHLVATANVLIEQGLITYRIEPLASARIITDGQGEELTLGSALAVPSNLPVGGLIRFDVQGFGVAGVGAAKVLRRAVVPVQRAGGINTGLAVRNIGDTPATVHLMLRDLEGLMVPNGTADIPLEPNAREALFLNEIFVDADTENFLGTLLFESDVPVAALALEQGAQPGQFTTLPVTEVVEDIP